MVVIDTFMVPDTWQYSSRMASSGLAGILLLKDSVLEVERGGW